MTDHAKRIRHALYSGPQPHLLRVQDRLLDEREALAALDALLAENQRLREALEVGLICMCDSCVERNKALLEEFGTEGVREPTSGERARSASADVRVAGAPSGAVGADSEALAGDAE